MKRANLVLGILAHVDAGKTTLAESILYLSGSIGKLGRVDHQDAFLDHHGLERARGITIFSKQAELALGDRRVTLLDTPGHVDFSAEMERTLQVLDAAILVISGPDGIQAHTRTLWRLLKSYQIPVFLFINKMDLPGADRAAILSELQQRLDGRCMDFSPDAAHGSDKKTFYEDMAVSDEALLEKYLEADRVEEEDISRLIRERKIYPCYFGSALRCEGVEEFRQGIGKYAMPPDYGEDFGARIFKITRDEQNNRLTYMKITGGQLRVKTVLSIPAQPARSTDYKSLRPDQGEDIITEKADQIRIYSGGRYQVTDIAEAGEICAVTGLEKTAPGMGLGQEKDVFLPVLEPVLTYQIELPEGTSAHVVYSQLSLLEEEDPLLHIAWDETSGRIQVQVMGEVQIEILKSIIMERFGVAVIFGKGSIVYKETIAAPVEGMGHFEPLRHYAEVHLLMEPSEQGSGLTFAASLSEDELDRNWQRLIMTHLKEKPHRGVLTGAEITDMKITLVAGKSHIKHTEGGDFRQATYRAVRQGLMSARCILLEPVYSFRLEIPEETVGRAMSDISRMQGSSLPPQTDGGIAVLTGSAPVSSMQGYMTEVIAYTRGRGRLFCSLKGYEPCHNPADVIAAAAYDPEADVNNPSSSVFCAHGAGFIVTWDKAADYMHIKAGLSLSNEGALSETAARETAAGETAAREAAAGTALAPGNLQFGQGSPARPPQKTNLPKEIDLEKENKELEEIFRRTYGTAPQPRTHWNRHRYHDKNNNNIDDNNIDGNNSDKKNTTKSNTATTNTATTSTITKKAEHSPDHIKRSSKQDNYLLVDGYNIIFAWQELRELAEGNLEAARGKLADILCNYQGYKDNIVILVYDAYRVEGNPGEHIQYLNIHIVYTKEAETADMYIEKVTHEIGRKHHVTVATSDAMEQMIVWGQGAARLSAEGLREEIEQTARQFREEYLNRRPEKTYLFDHLEPDMASLMEDIRLGNDD